jgi:hypothetical protein
MMKYQLYDQVESDYSTRLLRRILQAMRANVINQKMEKINEIMER